MFNKMNKLYNMKLLYQLTAIFFIMMIAVGRNTENTTNASSNQITGIVLDLKTGEPLIGVNVLIKDSFIGTATDNFGRFVISDLRNGKYDLVISMIGYRKKNIRGIVVNGISELLEVQLKQDVLSSPQVVVTTSRKEQDIMESPLSIVAIGIRDIQEKGAINLKEVLPYEAGVNTVNGQLNIRGASGYTMGAGERSLMLLDGIPLLGSASGNISWSIVPTSEIERVEIVKSGGSALYGSSALGGVLNIITRNAPPKQETKVRFKIGQYSHPKFEQWQWRENPGMFYTTELTHATPFGPHSIWVRLQKSETDGYTQLGWANSYNITGKLKLNYSNKYSASVYANYFSDKEGIGTQWKSPADPFESPNGYENDYGIGNKLNLNGFFNYIYSQNVVMKVRGALYDVYWRNYSETNTDFSREKKYYGEVQFTTSLLRFMNTIYGLAIQSANINSKLFGDHQSNSGSIYLLSQIKIPGGITISTGGRWENYFVDDEVLDQSFAPQFAVNLKFNEWMALRSSVSYGFRVPTIAELFTESKLGVFEVKPNPDLVAEKSFSYEAGSTVKLLSEKGFGLTVDGNVFQYNYENLVEPTPDETGIIHFENIRDARITGAEIGLKAGLLNNHLLLQSAYTYLDPVEVNSSGEVIDTLAYRFRHTFVSSISAYWEVLTASIEYRYSSRMEKVGIFQENKETGQDKRVWNASVGYKLRDWQYLLRIENIFQYYYVELERNMGEERNFSITITKIF